MEVVTQQNNATGPSVPTAKVPTLDEKPQAVGMDSCPVKAAHPLTRLNTMERLLRQFRTVAGSQGYLSEKEFQKAADIRSDLFAERLFKAIDADDNGCITCDEFVNFMYTLECQDLHGRLRMLFNLYDLDGSGGLSHYELSQILMASVNESNSLMEYDLIEHLAMCILDNFDTDDDGEVSFDEFVAAISKYPDLLVGLTLVGLGPEKKQQTGIFHWLKESMKQGYRNVINNPQRATWIVLLVALLFGAFWWRASRYADDAKSDLMGWSLPIAKGCGQMIKVTTALILLPVSRNTTTWLRETPLRYIIPFDDAVAFHILLGTLGFIFAWIHALAHVNDILCWGNPKYSHLFYKAFPDEEKQPTYVELGTSLVAVSGIIMLVTYTLVFATASNWPRRTSWMQRTSFGKKLNNFNLIWYMHHLVAVYIAMLLVHPIPHIPDEKNEWGYSDTWAWIGIPVLIYILERIARLYRQTKSVRILSAELLPGKVLALTMSKPRGFNYEPGMYVYVNCPRLAQFEWHPFSLTSAPSADHLSMHIRVAGDWTEDLYNRFRDYELTKRSEEFQLAHLSTVLPKLQTMGKDVASLPALMSQKFEPSKLPTGEVFEQAGSTMEHQMSRALSGMDRQMSTAPSVVSELYYAPDGSITVVERRIDGASDAEVPISCNPQSEFSSENGDLQTARSTANSEIQGARELSFSSKSPQKDAVKPDIPTLKINQQQGGYQLLTPFAFVTDPIDNNSSEDADDERKPEVKPMTKCRSSNLPMSSLGVPDMSKCPSSALPLSSPVVHRQPMHSFKLNLAHIKDDDDDDEIGEIRDADANTTAGKADTRPPVKLQLDGPFGAPAQDYKDYSTLLLVGAGIGVTPFASVLNELVYRMGLAANGDPKVPVQGMPRLQKVYFHWSVRSQSEVVWFSRVLEAISQEDKCGILEINVHITGLRSSNDVRTMPLKLVQVAVHNQTGMDVMSGLNGRVLTRFGRPDWSHIFQNLQMKHSNDTIGVFYSGPNTLGSVLRRLSEKYSKKGSKFRFTKESFGYW